MKQKRLVSMIGALVLIISVIVLITGCPQANGNKDKKENIAISYIGDYVGKGENHSGIGNWEFTISTSGSLSGWFQILSEEKSECSGSIKSDGSFTGTGKTKLEPVNTNSIYYHSKINKATEHHIKFIKTSEYFSKSLKSQKISFNLIALLISLPIIVPWISPI